MHHASAPDTSLGVVVVACHVSSASPFGTCARRTSLLGSLMSSVMIVNSHTICMPLMGYGCTSGSVTPFACLACLRLPARWISLLGALMSCGYCSIAIVMSILHAAKHGPATQWRHEGISQVGAVGMHMLLTGYAYATYY